jgi:UDP-N-acetylmuramoyl-tripeptide--D-alanyl-D-alanine ligase
VTLDDELHPTFTLETPWGVAEVVLRLRGAHQVSNAAMAIGVAAHLGVPLAVAVAGVGDAITAPHRMELHRSPSGVTVLNDAYNSSPTSAAVAIEALAGLRVDGRRIAVLGEMRELGAHANDEHEALGRLAAEAGIDLVVVVGAGAEPIARGARTGGATVVRVPDAAAACRAVMGDATSGDAVLVKASRAAGLELVAEALLAVPEAVRGITS